MGTDTARLARIESAAKDVLAACAYADAVELSNAELVRAAMKGAAA